MLFCYILICGFVLIISFNSKVMDVFVNARFLTQPITGTQRYAIELCRELKRRRPEIILLAPDNIVHKAIAEELDVKIVGKIKKGIVWEQVELPLLLKRRGNPLLINLCNLAPIIYSNNIVTILDLSFHLHPEWFSPTFSALYNFFIPKAATRSLHIVTISENSKKDISENYNIAPSKISIVYPSVPSVFLEKNHNIVKKDYGNYILSVSSIDPRKNFIGLIKAFKNGNFNDTKLLIVGSENKIFADQSIKQLVGNDDRIVFTGYVNDSELVNLYKNAQLFVYPSFFEGFGIPPLEAMACGCPTVVSETTSMPEICGDASVYIDPYNLNSITEGLHKVLNNSDLRETLVKNGYSRINLFNKDNSLDRLLEVIDKVNI